MLAAIHVSIQRHQLCLLDEEKSLIVLVVDFRPVSSGRRVQITSSQLLVMRGLMLLI